MGFTFAFTEAQVANMREVRKSKSAQYRSLTEQTDDALNGAAGGCAAGFIAGIRGELA